MFFLSSSSRTFANRLSLAMLRMLNVYRSHVWIAAVLATAASSSALCSSASRMSLSISSCDKREPSFLIWICLSAPVEVSFADTVRTPSASISYVTVILGTPRGIGGISFSSNRPSRLLSRVMRRSPSKTWIRHMLWLSSLVVNVCTFLAGMVVFRLMSTAMVPPAASRPRLSGVTSRSTKSSPASPMLPSRMAACTAAPYATASSGLILLLGSLPSKKLRSSSTTLGMRVEPPTRMTSSTSLFSVRASTKTR
mmetsp:Transcript_24139/g.35280  ORF Transcript_24139/g.35280 Transcript_24139/m.35280 type:complete len:253 (-) Transcript_24139:1057-1815(-)